MAFKKHAYFSKNTKGIFIHIKRLYNYGNKPKEQENEKIIIHIKKCHENVIFNANKKQNSKKWLP